MVTINSTVTSRSHGKHSKLKYALTVPVFALVAFFTCNTFSSISQGRHTSMNASRPNPTPNRLEFVHITKTAGSSIEKAGAAKGIVWGACHYMNISEVGCYDADIKYIAPNFQSYALTSPWHAPPKILQNRVESFRNPYFDARLFTVVRNPYDRAISEYYCPWTGYKRKNQDDAANLNKWLQIKVKNIEKVLSEEKAESPEDRPKIQGPGQNEDPYDLAQKHFINQAEYVYDNDKKVIDHVLHYETLDEDFKNLMEEYGLNVKLPDKSHGIYNNDSKKLTHMDLNPETIAIINRYAAPDFELFHYQKVTSFNKGTEYSLEPQRTE